jgi:hypothetical protein
MKRVRIATSIAACLAYGLVASCSSPSGSDTDLPPLDQIQLAPGAVTLTHLNEVVQLEATGRTASGSPVVIGDLTWRSDDPQVATVSSTGLVKATGDGTARITASVVTTQRTVTAEVVVQVARRLAGLQLSPGTTTLRSLSTPATLILKGFDAGGAEMTPGAVTWVSTVPAVATVSQVGVVTPVSNGETRIRATSGEHVAEAVVRVEAGVAQVVISGGQTPFKGIDGTMQLTATARDELGLPVNVPIEWKSSNPAVGSISSTGLVTTHAAGSTTIEATAEGGVSAQWTLVIQTIHEVPVDPYLATPIAGAAWELPVVLLWFLPTRDGVNLDVRKSPDYWSLNPRTLAEMEAEVLRITRHRKMAVEEGSRFRAYSNGAALPSIGYRIVKHVIVYEHPPASARTWPGTPGNPRFIDYHAVFSRLGLHAFMTANRVREVWVATGLFDGNYPSYDPTIHRLEDMRTDFESNMSSPSTGDISNSFRWNDDLPILGHTYILYGINIRRSQAEAVHNVGHQLEAMFGYVSDRQNPTHNLFWRQFVGQDGLGQFVTGRAGWTHMPPNTTTGYDYLNQNLVASDIANWLPFGGPTAPVNVNTWGNRTFNWPGGPPPSQREETQWYIHWMQSLPGRGEPTIPYAQGFMVNWWKFVADWDAATSYIDAGWGLFQLPPATLVDESRRPVPGATLPSQEVTRRAGPSWPIPHDVRGPTPP